MENTNPNSVVMCWWGHRVVCQGRSRDKLKFTDPTGPETFYTFFHHFHRKIITNKSRSKIKSKSFAISIYKWVVIAFADRTNAQKTHIIISLKSLNIGNADNKVRRGHCRKWWRTGKTKLCSTMCALYEQYDYQLPIGKFHWLIFIFSPVCIVFANFRCHINGTVPFAAHNGEATKTSSSSSDLYKIAEDHAHPLTTTHRHTPDDGVYYH
jgi:hypothetical protein